MSPESQLSSPTFFTSCCRYSQSVCITSCDYHCKLYLYEMSSLTPPSVLCEINTHSLEEVMSMIGLFWTPLVHSHSLLSCHDIHTCWDNVHNYLSSYMPPENGHEMTVKNSFGDRKVDWNFFYLKFMYQLIMLWQLLGIIRYCTFFLHSIIFLFLCKLTDSAIRKCFITICGFVHYWCSDEILCWIFYASLSTEKVWFDTSAYDIYHLCHNYLYLH